ncbi:MAG: histidine kinase N-terminal 7TM domain-containing protein [Myxococcota bacterium]|nr:histidine kinase N-terminal 7TM domain-containing protein [Myxococcota bacterium]
MPYSIGIQAAMMLALWVLLCAWSRDRHSDSGPWFVALAAALVLWCAGEVLFGFGAVDPVTRDRISFLGILATPPLWVGVAAHSGGTDFTRRVPWFPLALLAPSAVFYALLWSGPLAAVFLISDGGIGKEGPLFDVWMLWAYTLMAGGLYYLLFAVRSWPRRGLLPRMVALCAAVLLPVLGNAVYVYGSLDPIRDPTPILMALSAMPLRRALFASRFFEVLPVEQQDIVAGMPVAVVLADATGTVVMLNRRAEEVLSHRRAQLIGRSLDAVLQLVPEGVGSRVANGPGGAQCAVLGVS